MPEIKNPLTPPVLDLVHGTNFAYVATTKQDGSPWVIPTWVDADDGHLLINTAAGRIWVRNLERDERICCLVHNASDPREYALIEGELADFVSTGADAHFSSLALRYIGVENLPPNPGEHRLIVRITPRRVVHIAPDPAPEAD
jgi:PPOX class probable F420-dependent enzyme